MFPEPTKEQLIAAIENIFLNWSTFDAHPLTTGFDDSVFDAMRLLGKGPKFRRGQIVQLTEAYKKEHVGSHDWRGMVFGIRYFPESYYAAHWEYTLLKENVGTETNHIREAYLEKA